MNAGRLQVSTQLLAERLGLPDGCRIENAEFDHGQGCVVLHLAGEGLPPIPEGRAPMFVSLVYRLQPAVLMSWAYAPGKEWEAPRVGRF